MITKSILFWFPMIVIAFGNALLRESVFSKSMSAFHAHQWSTVTLMILCALYAWFVFPNLKIDEVRQAWTVGLIWVVLTVLFEFILGRSTGKSWQALLEQYNILAGRIWLLFLIWLLLLPALCLRLKGAVRVD